MSGFVTRGLIKAMFYNAKVHLTSGEIEVRTNVRSVEHLDNWIELVYRDGGRVTYNRDSIFKLVTTLQATEVETVVERSSSRIEAIKEWRAVTGLGLKEAKEEIDPVWDAKMERDN